MKQYNTDKGGTLLQEQRVIDLSFFVTPEQALTTDVATLEQHVISGPLRATPQDLLDTWSLKEKECDPVYDSERGELHPEFLADISHAVFSELNDIRKSVLDKVLRDCQDSVMPYDLDHELKQSNDLFLKASKDFEEQFVRAMRDFSAATKFYHKVTEGSELRLAERKLLSEVLCHYSERMYGGESDTRNNSHRKRDRFSKAIGEVFKDITFELGFERALGSISPLRDYFTILQTLCEERQRSLPFEDGNNVGQCERELGAILSENLHRSFSNVTSPLRAHLDLEPRNTVEEKKRVMVVQRQCLRDRAIAAKVYDANLETLFNLLTEDIQMQSRGGGVHTLQRFKVMRDSIAEEVWYLRSALVHYKNESLECSKDSQMHAETKQAYLQAKSLLHIITRVLNIKTKAAQGILLSNKKENE